MTVRVRCEGRAVPFATVRFFGETLVSTECDDQGRVEMRIEPGEYEVLLSRHPEDRRLVARYEPEGASSAWCTVPQEGCRELDLELYVGAQVFAQLRRNAGPVHVGTSELLLSSWHEAWTPVDQEPMGSASGGACWQGLEPGWYALSPRTPGLFEPQVFELERDARHHLDVELMEQRVLRAAIHLRRSSDAEALPLQPRVSYRRIEDGPKPPPHHRRTARWVDDRAEFLLYPGEYEVTVSTDPGPSEGLTYALPWRTWKRRLSVPSEGSVPTIEWELDYPEAGTLVALQGKLHGWSADMEEYFQLRYQAGGRLRTSGLNPRADGSFEVLLDRDYLAEAQVSWEQRWGLEREVLGITSLETPPVSLHLQTILR